MFWVNLVLYSLFTYGLCNIIVFGNGPFNIVTHIRNLLSKIPTFDDMLNCMMCTSANVGWILSLIDTFLIKEFNFTPFNLLISNPSVWYYSIIGDLFITSGIVWLIHTLQEYFETETNVHKKKLEEWD